MHNLVCHADYTSFYVAYAVAGIFAAIGTTLFMKNLDRIRTAVRGPSARKAAVSL